ncbi:universal stress protein [Streptomyces sp. NPDC059785]|uniref:universal stress protein n=1 Tax=unclassified Streptomyces TaxID=2593676 RepID=UPI0036653D86
MGSPLVVGVDGFEPSLRAVDWAADEAARRELPLRLVHAAPEDHRQDIERTDHLTRSPGTGRAEDILDAAARRAHRRQAGVKVTTDVLPGEPGHALVRAGHDASALVLGTRGRNGLAELLLGSVSLAVAARADCPVIVLRGDRTRAGAHGRVLLGVGEHPADSAAARFALRQAESRGVRLEAVRAWRCPAHESTDHPLLVGEPARLHEQRAAETLEEALRDAPARVRVHRRTAEGAAGHVLLAASHDADLLVVGARRGPGDSGPRLGGVVHAVLHHAACPVAVVPERA